MEFCHFFAALYLGENFKAFTNHAVQINEILRTQGLDEVFYAGYIHFIHSFPPAAGNGRDRSLRKNQIRVVCREQACLFPTNPSIRPLV